MSDWTAGYIAGIDYTFGYYAELNPFRHALPFAYAGIAPRPIRTVCELGFGQGLSINIHAAAGQAEWWGTDFNPSQATFARELAQASGAPVHLFDQSFEEFCARADLPDFDCIALHGIWSWVSDANRHVIVDFLRRKLKVGGIVYLSYNAQPGRAVTVPLRELLHLHAERMGAPGAAVAARVDGALGFAEALMQVQPRYAIAHLQVEQTLKQMRQMRHAYLAHEYFNRDWEPMSFARMADLLGAARLDFACSAHYHDLVAPLELTPEQEELLRGVADPVLRETTRDFIINRSFRRDFWVRGARRLSGLDKAQTLADMRMVLVAVRSTVELKVQTLRGESTLPEHFYAPVLDLMADHRIRTIDEIRTALPEGVLTRGQLHEVILVLAGMQVLQPAQDDAAIRAAQPRCAALNRRLCLLARSSGDIGFLACPVTGGGISVNRIEQMFLLLRSQGLDTPEQWADAAIALGRAQGQTVRVEGGAAQAEEAVRAELVAAAHRFQEQRLPVLQALAMV